MTKERETTYAEILVSAVGILQNPRYPDIPGLETFKGDVFHSARWNREVDLRGKKVAVIGNATSAYVNRVRFIQGMILITPFKRPVRPQDYRGPLGRCGQFLQVA